MKARPVGYFDGKLYPLYRAASIPLLPILRPEATTLIVQRQLFLADQIENPIFHYDRFDDGYIQFKHSQLIRLKEIVADDKSLAAPVVTLYRRIIRQEMIKLGLLSALRRLLSNPSDEPSLDVYQSHTALLYGTPICSLYLQTIEVLGLHIVNSIENQLNTKEYGLARSRLQSLVKSYQGAAEKCPLVLKRRPRHVVDKGSIITDETELWAMFKSGMRELGLPEWGLEIDDSGLRTTFAVALAGRKLKAPSFASLSRRSREKAMTPSMVRGLIAHELGTHALRYERGLRSPLQLLSTGLDLYEQGAEGLATYREQFYTGANDYAGFSYYLAAGLASGLASQPRTFREVFSILVDYYLVCDGVSLDQSRILAWEATWRVFRGTPGNIRGLIYTKDIIYREGNTLAWEFFPEFSELPDDEFNIGKYDPTNREHVRVLTELELISPRISELHQRVCLPNRSELLLCYPEFTSNIVKS